MAGIFGQNIAGSPVTVDASGQLGIQVSSRRYKQAIADMGETSRGLFDLRPVTFRYIERAAGGDTAREYGLIAEEVAEIYPDLVVRNAAGEIETVQYHELTRMLLNEIQRQQRQIGALERRLGELAAQVSRLTR